MPLPCLLTFLLFKHVNFKQNATRHLNNGVQEEVNSVVFGVQLSVYK